MGTVICTIRPLVSVGARREKYKLLAQYDPNHNKKDACTATVPSDNIKKEEILPVNWIKIASTSIKCSNKK